MAMQGDRLIERSTNNAIIGGSEAKKYDCCLLTLSGFLPPELVQIITRILFQITKPQTLFPILTKFKENYEFKSILTKTDIPIGIVGVKSDRILFSDEETNSISVHEPTGALFASIGSNGQGCYEFCCPANLVVDQSWNIYICDYYNKRVQVFDSELKWKDAIYVISGPQGIAISRHEDLFITFDGYGTGSIEKWTKDGRKLLEFKHPDPEFGGLNGIAIDNNDQVFVVESQKLFFGSLMEKRMGSDLITVSGHRRKWRSDNWRYKR